MLTTIGIIIIVPTCVDAAIMIPVRRIYALAQNRFTNTPEGGAAFHFTPAYAC